MDLRSLHRRRGFTLIELLVVIAIIGILATLVVTQLGSARVKARNSSAKSDVTEAGKAIEVYRNDDAAGGKVVMAGAATASTAGASTASPVTGWVDSLASDCWDGSITVPAAANCNVSTLDGSGAQAGGFKSIFTTKEQATTVASPATGTNTYGVSFNKTPGSGYVYFYITDDHAVATTPSGTQSAYGDYYFMADLGPNSVGAGLDSARYYYVHDGVSSNTNATTSLTAAGVPTSSAATISFP